MNVLANNAYAPSRHSYDRNFTIIVLGILTLFTFFTTWLHHLQPQVLKVPSNVDISSWQHPPFEDTLLYERMTPDERAEFLANGVPGGGNVWRMLPGDIIVIFLGLLIFFHSMKYCGLWMSVCFLVGSFVFTGLEESMFILLGRVLPPDAVNHFGEPATGTYWFTKGFFWFIETPLTACIGWYFIAYACVLTAGVVFPNKGILWRAVTGGLIAMGIDLWVDPVITSPEYISWVWPKGAHLIIFGIPVTNFIGWFNLIFLFAVFWEMLPGMEERWGRPNATVLFFLILIAAEFAIAFFFMMIWPAVIGSILTGMGFDHAVMIPKGW